MMKPPFFINAAALVVLGVFAAAPGALRAAADDTTRRAQQALRDQGFYYGPIDGASGDETTQAIRRYQIRNGLAVSGQLNAETLRSLQINAAPPSSSASSSSSSAAGPTPRPRSEPTPPPLSTPAAPTPPRTITGRPDARTNPPAAPTPPPPSTTPPRSRPDLRADAAGPAPLPPGAQTPSVPLTGFFARTPYEFAPPAVQADVLRRAQRALGRGGFYDGPADGQPGRRTVEALGEFQGAFRLPRTRRLDTPTLRVLRLLPGAGSNLPEPIPARRRPPAGPEVDHEDEDDEEDAPAIRIRPRPGGPPVYEGRIIH